MSANVPKNFFWRGIRRFHSCRGMTLVELMVVTGILGIVMGAVYSLMLPVQKSTFTQTEVVDLQDDLRLALKQITMDVRHAGLLVDNTPPPAGVGTLPITVGNAGAQFTLRRRINNFASAAQVLCQNTGTGQVTYRITPPLMTGRFSTGMRVKLVDSAGTLAGTSPIATITINDPTSNDANGADLNRYNDDTVTFASDDGSEIEGLSCSMGASGGTFYVFPTAPGEPEIRTVTYIFTPQDLNPDPARPRPTLRRFEDWPPDGTPIPDPLPNPLPPNWLLLGGDTPVAGDVRKTIAAQFAYDSVAQIFTIDITGSTTAYNPNNPNDDSLANAKTRRLQTRVALRNALLE